MAEECTRDALARGMCGLHYARWRKHGNLGDPGRRWRTREGACTIEGCRRQILPNGRKGMCGKHYFRQLKGQAPQWEQTDARMDAVDIAWLTGIVEGEGCISVRQGSERTRACVKLTVNMCDQDVVRRLAEVTGTGTLALRPGANERCKPQLVWAVSARRDVARLLLAMAPLLGERRKAKAGEAITLIRQLEQARSHPEAIKEMSRA